MTLTLLPALVWALDDVAEPTIRGWYSRLDSDTRIFVRVACDREQARDRVREFRTEDFSARMTRIGINTVDAGIRVRMVLVASGMGPDAFQGWTDVEAYVDGLEREVLSIERIRIVLAKHTRSRLEERELRLHGLRHAPWLLSTQLDTRHEVSEERFQDLACRLFNGLLLAEPRVVQHRPSVWDDANPEHVKVFGFPRHDPEEIVQKVGELFTQAALFDARAITESRPAPPAVDRTRVVEVARRFRDGRIPADEALRTILGRLGMASWQGHHLVAYASDDLRRVLGRLAAGPVTPPQQEFHGSSSSASRWSWFARFLRALGCRRQEAPAAPPPSSVVETSEMDFVRAKMERAKQLLDHLGARAPSVRPMVHVPEALGNAWHAALTEAVRTEFSVLAGELGGQPRAVDDLILAFADRVRRDIEQRLFTPGDELRVSDPQVAKSLEGLRVGTQFRFTGSLRGGHHPETGAIASSDNLPVLSARALSYRYWRSAGVVLFAASVPIPSDRLAW